MSTTARNRPTQGAKPKRSTKSKLVGKPTVVIPLEQIRIGDKIATGLMEHPMDGILATKSIEVKEVGECAGRWRTHIHINKYMCYDLRGTIRIVA